MAAMGRMRMAAPALLALAVASIAGCGSSQTASVTRAPAGSTKTVTRTVTSAHTAAASGSKTTAGSSGSSTGPSAHSTGAAGTICRAHALKLVYLGGQGAAGHGLIGFALRNTGSTPCTTIGYPGILFLSHHGAALPTHPRHTTSDFFGHTKYGQVTVAPGQEASFRLGVTHGSASPKGCVTAASLQVIAPNDTGKLRIRLPGGLYECRGVATESPVQPGTTAYH
jgi:hypothetical protein